jgi:hypothetical protein
MAFVCLTHGVLQGKIACANVLSDLYAMGVTDCDNMLMLVAASNKMSEKERDTIMPLVMRGFKVSLCAHTWPHRNNTAVTQTCYRSTYSCIIPSEATCWVS